MWSFLGIAIFVFIIVFPILYVIESIKEKEEKKKRKLDARKKYEKWLNSERIDFENKTVFKD